MHTAAAAAAVAAATLPALSNPPAAFARQTLQAKEKARHAGHSHSSFICCDLDEIELPGASFDAVLCSAALVFLPDVPAALARWRGWLRAPGGRLAFNAPRGQASQAFRLFADLARLYGAPELEDPSAMFSSPGATAALVRGAGFGGVDVVESVEGRAHAGQGPAQYAESMWAVCSESPFAPAAALLPADQLGQLRAEFLQAAQDLGGRLMRPDGTVCEPHTMLRVVARC